jgi:hypothetical protein
MESKDSVNPRWDVVGDAVRELAVWQKEQKVYRYKKFSKIMKTNINIVVVFQFVNVVENKMLFVKIR